MKKFEILLIKAEQDLDNARRQFVLYKKLNILKYKNIGKILTITRFVELKRIINKMLKINKEG